MSEDIILEEVSQDDSPSELKPESQTREDIPEDWNSLTGKAQDRFKKIIAQKNEVLTEKQRLQDELEQLRRDREVRNLAPMPNITGDMTPEEKAAIDRLKQLGAIVTPEEMKAEREKIRQEMQAERDREILEQAHSNLESRYDGKEGYPAYDKTAIENHMRSKGIYDPEAAYRDLYWEEILEAETSKKAKTTKEPYTERTKSRISSGQPWTPETLSERLRKADGRQFYLKNKDKINKLYASWQQSEG